MNSWDYDERKPYLAYTNDGLTEMLLGAVLMLAMVLIRTDFVYMTAIWVILLIPIMWSLKRWITVPRLTKEEVANVNIHRAQKLRMVAIVALAALVLGGAFVFATFFTDSTLGQYARIFWMSFSFLMVVGLIAAMGFYLGQWRWYVYAALAVITAVLVTYGGVPFIEALLVLGAIIFMVGLAMLFRFLSTHPKLPEGEHPAV